MGPKELLRGLTFSLPVDRSCYSSTSFLARPSPFLSNLTLGRLANTEWGVLQKALRRSSQQKGSTLSCQSIVDNDVPVS